MVLEEVNPKDTPQRAQNVPRGDKVEDIEAKVTRNGHSHGCVSRRVTLAAIGHKGCVTWRGGCVFSKGCCLVGQSVGCVLLEAHLCKSLHSWVQYQATRCQCNATESRAASGQT